MEKKKVAFFFGAGAEGKGNFDIISGYEYLKQSLFPKEDTYQPILKKFFNKQDGYFSAGYKYRKDHLDSSDFLLRNFILAKCEDNIEFLREHIKDVISILSDEDKKLIIEYYKDSYDNVIEILNKDNDTTLSKEDADKITEEFKEILLGGIDKYTNINNELLKSLFKKGKNDTIEYDLNVGVGGILDSYFHTIINPQQYGIVRFSKIFNYYWACYFAILTPVISFLKKKTNDIPEEWMITDSALNYNHILNNIHEVTKRLYSQDMTSLDIEGTYYRLIKSKLDQYKKEKKGIECSGVITTNYYKFCETICNKAVYLNGQLKYFEFPEMLEVRDFNSDDNITNENLFFPFIFGQSLIKPIVNDVQICEFAKFKKLLKDIDILVILGYNINEDDNHINAMLHSYVKQRCSKSKKRLIVVGEYKNDNEQKAVSQKLKCEEENIEYCTVKYGNNSEVINKMFNKILEGIK